MLVRYMLVITVRLLLVAQTLTSVGVWASDQVPEIARFPHDAVIFKGPQKIEANVDGCRIEMDLRNGEFFASSNETGEAIFYKPSKRFAIRSAPYLYKPAVEHYSGVAWGYRKPAPFDEAWFGMKCTIGDQLEHSDPYLSLNCPAYSEDSTWRIAEAYKARVPGAVLEGIAGEGWDGFIIFSPEKTGQDGAGVLFCIVGESTILMGQGQFSSSDAAEVSVIKRAILSMRLLGARE